MRILSVVSMIAGIGCGAALAQPKFNMDQVRKDMQNHLSDPLRMGHAWGMPFMHYPETGIAGDGFYTAWFTVFSRDGRQEGYAALRYLPGDDSKSIQDQYYLEMEGGRIYPEMTDSILVFGKIGYPAESGWLFRKVDGKIDAYAMFPLGPVSAISAGDGKRKLLKRKSLDTLFKDSPLAYAHADADPEFAVRIYNRYSDVDRLSGGGLKPDVLRKVFLADSLGGWEIAKLKKESAEDPVEIALLARYYCQKGKTAEGREHLAKAQAKLPDLYSLHWAEASCLEKEGRAAEALAKLLVARGKSPNDGKLLANLNERIGALKRSLARAPGSKP